MDIDLSATTFLYRKISVIMAKHTEGQTLQQRGRDEVVIDAMLLQTTLEGTHGLGKTGLALAV